MHTQDSGIHMQKQVILTVAIVSMAPLQVDALHVQLYRHNVMFGMCACMHACTLWSALKVERMQRSHAMGYSAMKR